jgi:hypothetical protein
MSCCLIGYHVTVILNPVASSGKGRKMYEEYCAPLLHLAGFKAGLLLLSARLWKINFKLTIL